MNFNFQNGKFRICQLTDIHLEADGDLIKYDKTLNLVREIITNTKPNLVVITGDISWGQKTEEGIDRLSDVFDEMNMLWAPVLGNHDGNPNDCNIKSRKEFADYLKSKKNCIMTDDDNTVEGNGNYTVTVGNDENDTEKVLFFIDSHEGDIYPSQIEWYRKKSASFPKNHEELAFFHVPIPEYLEVWNYEDCKGYNLENICSTRYNDGLFSAFARGGAMKGVFVGHDHVNDFEGTLHGIRLCYGRASGYQCYGYENFKLGARLIDLTENQPGFDTSIYLQGGEIYHQEFIHKAKLKRK